MTECRRLDNVHPDAPHPELWEGRTPKACQEQFFREMKNNREPFRRDMDRIKNAKTTLDMKIKGIKTITAESKEKIHKAMDEFQAAMDPLEEPGNNHCKPPSLYLPEFGKEFTDEPCPYTGKAY